MNIATPKQRITGRKHVDKIRAPVAERQICAPAYTAMRSAKIGTLQGINDAKHWRDRAAEMRVLSDEIRDSQAQRMMLKLANDYDKLADRAEDRAARDSPGPSPIPKA